MLDLLRPLSEWEVARIVSRHTPSKIHTLDRHGSQNTQHDDTALRAVDKRVAPKRNLHQAIQRQETILESIKIHSRDHALTVEQIKYYCGISSKESTQSDVQVLYELGLLTRQKVINRDGKMVWAYFVTK